MITMLKETTKWDVPINNGVYHVNDHDQLVAYHPTGGELKEFSKPMKRFSRARRTFIVLDTYEEDSDPAVESWNFAGSKPGVNYVVTRIDGNVSCTCPGAKYRGYCKHIDQIKGATA